MNTPNIAVPQMEQSRATTAAIRPFYWSVRREVWENRSLYAAPLVVMGFAILGSLIGAAAVAHKLRAHPPADPAALHVLVVGPFTMAPAPIMLATFIVGLVYSLDALYGERRDRSILFWKSMPVSDRTTVLSKIAVPLVVLPLIALVLSVIALAILLPLGSAIFAGHHIDPGLVWSEVRFVQEPMIMVYGLFVHALWFAPIYGWLLLVGAWAKRAPFIWAVLPLMAVGALERLAFGTYSFMRLLEYRLMGGMREAFVSQGKPGPRGVIDRLAQLDPARFLTAPGLWLGLALAAAFVAAAVRLRRYREPI